MTRPLTNTVQYFPHTTDHGDTMYILENRFGNTGYAFWYKLLEKLGKTENHYLDLNNPLTLEGLQALARIKDEETTIGILDLLAKLLAINPELWKNRIVWSENFVKGLEPVYKNRGREIPKKPIYINRNSITTSKVPDIQGITTSNLLADNPQGSIGSKGSIGKRIKDTASLSLFEQLWQTYPKAKRREKEAALNNFKLLKLENGQFEKVMDALKQQIANKDECDRNGKFCPEFKDIKRWIKSKCWLDEIESDSDNVLDDEAKKKRVAEYIAKRNAEDEAKFQKELAESHGNTK